MPPEKTDETVMAALGFFWSKMICGGIIILRIMEGTHEFKRYIDAEQA
jgi:hypothetical protein